jgi:hypothetical protein
MPAARESWRDTSRQDFAASAKSIRFRDFQISLTCDAQTEVTHDVLEERPYGPKITGRAARPLPIPPGSTPSHGAPASRWSCCTSSTWSSIRTAIAIPPSARTTATGSQRSACRCTRRSRGARDDTMNRRAFGRAGIVALAGVVAARNLRHRANQRADVRWHCRSSHAAPALPRPPQPEAPSVPGDDGLGLDDNRRPFRHPVQMRPRAGLRANGRSARAATAAAVCAAAPHHPRAARMSQLRHRPGW